MQDHFVRINPTGAALPADATHWTATHDKSKNLMWSKDLGEVNNFAGAEAAIAKTNADHLAGFDDWRLPTIEELSGLVRHDKSRPATDTEVFPDTENDWYFTSSPGAENPADCVWFVHFYYGDTGILNRDSSARVRAVRSVVPASQ